jgi:hypothetical protein
VIPKKPANSPSGWILAALDDSDLY